MTDPSRAAADAARAIADATGVERHDLAVIAGSGWGGAADHLGETVATLAAVDVPGFRAALVPGHGGTLRSVRGPDGARVLIIGARHHYYESRDVEAVAHPVRAAAAAGCRILVVTNAAGSTRADVTPGTVVLIADHINLTGASPLVGPRFVDMTDAYSPRLRALAKSVDPSLSEGVYAQFMGPQYETPAEVRAANALGADLVGMSTALEVIAARAEGLEVLGLSLVTNLGAGVAPQPLSHAEVLAAGEDAAPRIARLLADVVAAAVRGGGA